MTHIMAENNNYERGAELIISASFLSLEHTKNICLSSIIKKERRAFNVSNLR